MPLLEMKPPTAKLTLAVIFLPSSHSLAARGMIHLSRPFRVQLFGDPWQRWPRKASSGAAIPFANGAAAPGTKNSRAKGERPQRQGRKTAAPKAKDRSARDERQLRLVQKTAAPQGRKTAAPAKPVDIGRCEEEQRQNKWSGG
jgi:hypothetical protein